MTSYPGQLKVGSIRKVLGSWVGLGGLRAPVRNDLLSTHNPEQMVQWEHIFD